MDDSDIAIWLDEAEVDRDLDLEELGDVDGDELRKYLGAHPDPETDGIDCDTIEREDEYF